MQETSLWRLPIEAGRVISRLVSNSLVPKKKSWNAAVLSGGSPESPLFTVHTSSCLTREFLRYLVFCGSKICISTRKERFYVSEVYPADLIAKISLVFITLLSQIRASRQRLAALSATTGKTIFSLTKLLSLLR